ncbi:LuxR family two component transcriptional regulator [Herbaspirillum sp. SJZ099]|nr:response regulator transcription factor [Herbaspirillum sp. SJZ099]TWC71705.1 LuxR family two component transcriptional regulator [Herbaspirillum sp. SJZ099]
MKEFSVRLVVADDHPAVLVGTQHILGTAGTITVLGAARNSTELIALLDSQACDVLVTDYAMPGGEYGDGIALFDFLGRRYPSLKLIVMTMMDNPAVLRTLLAHGVRCILSKSDDPSHLIPAVHVAFSDGTYFSPSIAEMMRHPGEKEPLARPGLTARELDIVRLYVSGLTVNEIAERLHRSKQTVSSQKSSAMKKLGIERDADLFKYAIETGLLSSSAPPAP